MNLPNKLTVLRVILVPFFVLFLVWTLPGAAGELISRVLAAVFFSAAAITDAMDGHIARSRNLVTDFGKFMDPLADKFMVFGAILGFIAAPAYQYSRAYSIALLVAGLMVILRELTVTSLRLVVASGKEKKVVAASVFGKAKTISQCVWVLVTILEPVLLFFIPWHLCSWITLVAMTCLTVLSGLDYLKSYWPYIDPTK